MKLCLPRENRNEFEPRKPKHFACPHQDMLAGQREEEVHVELKKIWEVLQYSNLSLVFMILAV